MGEVHRARDMKLARMWPSRSCRMHSFMMRTVSARFQGEAQVLASLNNPNIAQIYGLEESGNTRCVVMELLEGETLDQRLKQDGLRFTFDPAAEDWPVWAADGTSYCIQLDPKWFSRHLSEAVRWRGR
jgi:serine/threonine protein kinase